jgi:hypothetical protein
MSKHRDVERADQFMDDYREDLKTIVNIDSGTFTKAGIDRDFRRLVSPRASIGKNSMGITLSQHIQASHSMALA